MYLCENYNNNSPMTTNFQPWFTGPIICKVHFGLHGNRVCAMFGIEGDFVK